MEDGTVVFTHCGSGSLSLSESCSGVTLDSVRLMGQGACALYAAKPGNVTLLGFTATADGYQCALLEGEAVPTGMVFPGNPLRVRFGVDTDELIGWIHREGVGHHWMVGYGHVGAEIRAWVEMASPHLRLVTR
jgi:L-arabinose isomerase